MQKVCAQWYSTITSVCYQACCEVGFVTCVTCSAILVSILSKNAPQSFVNQCQNYSLQSTHISKAGNWAMHESHILQSCVLQQAEIAVRLIAQAQHVARKAKLQSLDKVRSQACAKPRRTRSNSKSVQHRSYDSEEAAASSGLLQTHAGANHLTSGEFDRKYTDLQNSQLPT